MWMAWWLACTAGPDGDDVPTTCVADGPDVCDGVDNDCDGTVDEDPDRWWYADLDGDGWGDAFTAVAACEAPERHVDVAGDCLPDDSDYHGAVGPIRLVPVPAAESGLDAPHFDGVRRCLEEELLGGAALGDVDGDGDIDLFQPRLYATDQLLLNDGTGRFVVDPAFPARLGSSAGALFVDIDGDRDLDLAVTSLADDPALLYVNDGTGRFVEEAAERGFAMPTDECSDQLSISAADVDGDGDLDLAVAAWLSEAEVGRGLPLRSRLLRNDGTGHFTDVTLDWGLGFLDDVGAFGLLLHDVDRDGRPDLHVVADWGDSSLLRNAGSGFEPWEERRFTDEFGMGSDLGDVDGDGDLDWFVSSIWSRIMCDRFAQYCIGNRLYGAVGGKSPYEDVTFEAGVARGPWAFGAAFLDHDLDGDVDLLVTGGYPEFPFEDAPGQAWLNDGTGRFREATCEVGWSQRVQGRTLLPLDADRDGDLDVLLVHADTAPTLYRAEGAEGGWLEIELDQPGPNRFGIGAEIAVITAEGAPPQTRLLHANALFMGGPAPEVHFGLGEHTGALHEVRVRWPDGEVTVYDDVAPGQVTLRRP